MKLHLLGIPHTITRYDYSHCAFTGKVIRFSPMLRSVGYEVIHYGVAGAESGASRDVNVLSEDEQIDLMGGKPEDTSFVGNLANIGNPLYTTFNQRLNGLLKENLTNGDIICLPFGHAHSAALIDINKGVNPCVETGIGYPTTCESYRIFESNAWYHHIIGKQNTTGHDYNWVIPNYFDISQWVPKYSKGEYVLYFGRLTGEKGLDVVVEIARYRPDLKFIICGQGDPTPWLTLPNIEYHKPIHGTDRSELVRNAIAVLMPTRYVEPFGGVTIEAHLCGVPVLGSPFGSFTETIQNGVNGFRCHTLGDFLAGLERCENMDRVRIRKRAEVRYDMYRLAHEYDRAFKQVADVLTGKGWYALRSTIGEITKAVAPTVPSEWDKAQQWEKSWWLSNRPLWEEERRKQRVYAAVMHMPDDMDFGDKNILDVGAGPISMLLRLPFSEAERIALDPVDYGDEVRKQYEMKGIHYVVAPAEEMDFNLVFDEVWCYNVLQHVIDPKKVMDRMAKHGKLIRLYEWINIPPYQGHLHMITEELVRTAFPETQWEYQLWDVGSMKAKGLEGDYLALVLKSKTHID